MEIGVFKTLRETKNKRECGSCVESNDINKAE